jgi:UDP-2-acetamido-2-deoxy-ribo-hexuluronate aminotransferase
VNAPVKAFGKPIPFIDLMAQRRRLGARIDRAVMGAVEAGQWIMGPQVGEFERRLAAFGRAGHAVACANGTDALVLTLMAWEIGPGDAVFCPSFTFTATAEAAALRGATPVFVDILPDTYNVDATALERAVAEVEAAGRLKPKVVIAVDLFGQPADYPAIKAVADRWGLKLIADSAQGFGCTLQGEHPIRWADATTTSFFPAKPLGCYGDGGAILTDDAQMAERLDSVRVHGKAVKGDKAGDFGHDPKYLNLRIGTNSRLDTLQAAILLEKLDIFPDDIVRRNASAERYAQGLSGVVRTPTVIAGGVSTWAQYTIEVDGRDEVAAALKARGVPTAVYYPVPLHRQRAYADSPAPGGLPVTEAKARTVMSLPISADLEPEVQAYVIEAVREVASAG